ATLISSGTGGLTTTTGLALGADGNLYVSSRDTRQVLRFNLKTGAFIDVFAQGGGMAAPFQIQFGPDGNLYVAFGFTSDGVARFNGSTGAPLPAPGQAGALFVPPGQITGVRGLTFGPDGNIYVSSFSGDVIKRFDPTHGA